MVGIGVVGISTLIAGNSRSKWIFDGLMKDLMIEGWNNGELRFRQHVYLIVYIMDIYRYLSRLEVKNKDRQRRK